MMLLRTAQSSGVRIALKTTWAKCLALLVFCLFQSVAPYAPSSMGAAVVPKKPKALYFTGAGVYFFWQIGAAKYISEMAKNDDMPMPPILGASAGSLTGLLLLCQVDIDNAVNVALDLAEEKEVFTRASGLRGELKGLLGDWMQEILPEEIPATVLNQLSIALTPPPTNPFKSEPPALHTSFSSREDVIAACLASCHIPWFSSGAPMESFRGKEYIDGSFWYFVTKNRFTGLPLPDFCTADEIFWIDYMDDVAFQEFIGGESFISTHSPARVREMVNYGYQYMSQAHYQNELLPSAINADKPLDVPTMMLSQLEKERREWLKTTNNKEVEVEEDDLTGLGWSAMHSVPMHSGLGGGLADFTVMPQKFH